MAAAGSAESGESSAQNIVIRLDDILADRGMTLAELARRVDVTVVNLSVLKNGRAKAIRFSTLARICEALDCQPGELIEHRKQAEDR
ncbi:putative transcriptional regulator [Nocardiopsis mwathae]|uniref:Putative transcriptional regulator n=1 Tax=Nocardiopsis mwathae TaxID=1472723 RepID=A0A7W9YHX0_9ACTN|nr:helix-turn-helix transcriptional regulator [Nocardiopsis mwathae]MBB6172275.1 putative transcriptional regulator [Nocardiopsis mwathae]